MLAPNGRRPPRNRRPPAPGSASLRADTSDVRFLPPTPAAPERSIWAWSSRWTVFHVAFVLAVAALFEPARGRLQRTLDRVLPRERVDYRGTVQEVRAALAMPRDLDAIPDRGAAWIGTAVAGPDVVVTIWRGPGAHLRPVLHHQVAG